MTQVKEALNKISNHGALRTPEEHRFAAEALSTAMKNDMNNAAGTMAIKELMTGSDLPSSDPKAVIERFQNAQVWDNGYEAIFKNVNVPRPHMSWDIFTGGTGIVFKKLEAGGEIRMQRMGGEVTTATISYYAAGFEVLSQWVDNQQWWMVEEAATDFVNAYQRKKASIYYGLIEAVSSGRNVAYNTTGASQLAKDVATINAGITKLVTDAQTAKTPINVNQVFALPCPFELWPRVKAALGQYNATGESRAVYGEMLYNVVPVVTTFFATKNVFYVCVPGEKSQRADREQLTSEKARNIVNLSDIEVQYAAWGGAIGDENQFVRCATA